MRKYRNIPVEIDGVKFASKAEAARFMELKMLKRAGEITGIIECHPRWDLIVNGHRIGRYTADFCYLGKNGERVVEDVKSTPTKTTAYVLRKKLMKAIHGIEVQEV